MRSAREVGEVAQVFDFGDDVVVELQLLVEQGTSVQIHELTEELNRLSSEFASRRMDLHIGEALRGESIDEVEQ